MRPFNSMQYTNRTRICINRYTHWTSSEAVSKDDSTTKLPTFKIADNVKPSVHYLYLYITTTTTTQNRIPTSTTLHLHLKRILKNLMLEVHIGRLCDCGCKASQHTIYNVYYNIDGKNSTPLGFRLPSIMAPWGSKPSTTRIKSRQWRRLCGRRSSSGRTSLFVYINIVEIQNLPNMYNVLSHGHNNGKCSKFAKFSQHPSGKTYTNETPLCC